MAPQPTTYFHSVIAAEEMSGLRILRQAVSDRGYPRAQRQGGDFGGPLH